MDSLNRSCPYLSAVSSSCSENGCHIRVNDATKFTILKGETVRDVFLEIRKKKNKGIKAADYVLIRNANSNFEFFLLEMSINLHKPSVLISKFENSLNHLDKIICCDQERITKFQVKLIVAFRKVANSSQFQVVFRDTKFKFRGKELLLRNARCNGYLDI